MRYEKTKIINDSTHNRQVLVRMREKKIIFIHDYVFFVSRFHSIYSSIHNSYFSISSRSRFFGTLHKNISIHRLSHAMFKLQYKILHKLEFDE
jgi:hypothetical protein